MKIDNGNTTLGVLTGSLLYGDSGSKMSLHNSEFSNLLTCSLLPPHSNGYNVHVSCSLPPSSLKMLTPRTEQDVTVIIILERQNKGNEERD